MRIAFAVHDFDPGFGHGGYVHELARRFATEHDVHVFANRAGREPPPGVRVHRVPAWRANALSTVLSFPLPATAAVRGGFDVIHAQGLTTLRFDVVTAHICNQAWFAAQRRLGVSSWRQRTFESVVTPLERALYRRTRRAWVIAVSDMLRRELASYYGRTERVEVVRHGVDLERFDPERRAREGREVRARLGFGGSDRVALFVGDLRKGAAAALAALRRVPAARLLLVSRSDPAPWRERAAALGVLDRATFHPPVASIEPFYAAADLFLYPTPYDAFGLVVAEAMASGLPVVTTRRAGAAEIVRHGETGFLVDDPADEEGLAAAAGSLVADSALAKRVGAAARASLAAQGWDAVAARTLEVYRRVVDERAAGSRRSSGAGSSSLGPS